MKKLLLFVLLSTSTSAFAQKDTANICSKIDEFSNEFHNTKTFNTALLFETSKSYGIDITHYGATFYKEFNKGKVTYSLRLETSSNLADVTQQGVIILLKNKIKIRKPLAKVKTEVSTNGDDYTVYSFITLTQSDIALLKNSPITDFELYVDRGIVERPDDVYNMFLCLLNKK